MTQSGRGCRSHLPGSAADVGCSVTSSAALDEGARVLGIDEGKARGLPETTVNRHTGSLGTPFFGDEGET